MAKVITVAEAAALIAYYSGRCAQGFEEKKGKGS